MERERPSLSRPTLRSQDLLASEHISTFMVRVSTSLTSLGVGIRNITPLGPPPQPLRLLQQPGAAYKAHLCIRDVLVTAFASGSLIAPPSIDAILLYEDPAGSRHLIGGISGTLSTSGIVLQQPRLLLIPDAALTDARPQSLGAFGLEVITWSLGTSSGVTFTVYANIGVLYEAAGGG